jgi:hypothetical protein
VKKEVKVRQKRGQANKDDQRDRTGVPTLRTTETRSAIGLARKCSRNESETNQSTTPLGHPNMKDLSRRERALQ